MGPTWQSVFLPKEGRIPTAPPGPRNDSRVHKVRLRAARSVVAPHRGASIRHPPHHGGATGEARPKRVAQTAPRFCRTVATGGRRMMRQRAPRAGTFPPSPRTKLSRKWGSGADSPCQGEMAEGQRG